MSIIVYIENTEGKLKKGTLEAASYAAALGTSNGQEVVGVSIGSVSADELQKVANHGVANVISVSGEKVNHQGAANALAEIANE